MDDKLIDWRWSRERRSRGWFEDDVGKEKLVRGGGAGAGGGCDFMLRRGVRAFVRRAVRNVTACSRAVGLVAAVLGTVFGRTWT